MKGKICILLLTSLFTLYSLANSDKTNESKSENFTQSGTDKKTDICWTGTLNGKTPVFMHYQFDNEAIIGEIVYLNSKNKTPCCRANISRGNQNLISTGWKKKLKRKVFEPRDKIARSEGYNKRKNEQKI